MNEWIRIHRCFVTMFALAIIFNQDLVAKKKSSGEEEPIKVKLRIEPNYPNWAYNNGIGQGYAEIAFYVDEYGETSEFVLIEYSQVEFGNELLRAISSWKFSPAIENGVPVKRVCQVYWEFLPDRAIVTNALFDASKRIDGNDNKEYRELKYEKEEKLDAKIAMLQFAQVVVPSGYELSDPNKESITIRCRFFVDTNGSVVLPVVLDSSDPDLDENVIAALKQTVFERPLINGKQGIALLEKTYMIPLVTE